MDSAVGDESVVMDSTLRIVKENGLKCQNFFRW